MFVQASKYTGSSSAGSFAFGLLPSQVPTLAADLHALANALEAGKVIVQTIESSDVVSNNDWAESKFTITYCYVKETTVDQPEK